MNLCIFRDVLFRAAMGTANTDTRVTRALGANT